MKAARKVILIGGGVSGLSAGALLARAGIRVTLFEANDKLGGCCATTQIDGYTFNDGALFVAVPSLLDYVFEQLGLDRPALVPLRKIAALQTTTLPDGSVVQVGKDLDVTVTGPGGQPHSAVAREQIQHLLRKWAPVLDLFTHDLVRRPFSLRRVVLKGWVHLPKLRGTLASELNSLFTDPALRAALSAAVLYSGVPPERTPVSSILGLVAMFTEGLFLPEAGMGQIPAALGRAFVADGGEVVLNAPVRRILVDGGRVHGVDVKGRGVVEADAVVSTVGGMATFTSLLDPADVPRRARRQVKHAQLSHRAAAVQLGLANSLNGGSYFNAVVPFMDAQDDVFTPHAEEVRWPIYYIPTVVTPDLAASGGSIVEVFPPVDQRQPVDAWDEQQEQKLLAAVITSLSRRHDVNVCVSRVLSPRFYRDGLHLYQGAVYGLSPVVSPTALFRHRTTIAGLYLAGQTTFPGYGVAPAAVSGLLAAGALLETPPGRER